MILTTSIEWNDRPSSNCHLGHSIKKRDTGRQEGAVAEKAVPSSIPLFDDGRWQLASRARMFREQVIPMRLSATRSSAFLPGTCDGRLSRTPKGGSK
jgi:hypothetical protein